MSSKRLFNIFGSRSKLSRDDISRYGKSSSERQKHAIEIKASSGSFESDAMEGWEELSYDTTILKDLDKKFAGSSSTGFYVLIGGIVIVAGLTAIYLLNSSNDEISNKNNAQDQPKVITQLLEDQQITLDQSDLILPDPIEKMEPAPSEKQIKVETIKGDFKEMKSTYESEEPIVVEMLPIFDIEPYEIEPEIIRDHDQAKELYLHDLKLVDYTKYRSKPSVKTKQVLLTGTPASREGENSEDPEPITRIVDIPYVEYLDKTMSRFSRGSYKNALSRFEIILETYPDDVNANFYSGLCLFNLGEYEKAIVAFNKCTSGPYSNFDEEAQWMTALSYEKLGNKAKAKEYFQMIVKQGGFYKKQAANKMK